MSQKIKKTELIFRGIFPDLVNFSPDATECLKRFLGEQAKLFIDASVHIADERKISDYKEPVTPSHVIDAVNSYKSRHPTKGYNRRIITADIIIILASLILDIIIGFKIYEIFKTISTIIISVSVAVIIFCCYYKFSHDPNYSN